MLGDKTTPPLDDRIAEAHARLGIGPKRRKNAQPEHELQAALIAQVRVYSKRLGGWQPGPLGLLYPEVMDIYANANFAGDKGKRGGGWRVAEGVAKGVPDLFLPVPKYPAGGARISPPWHGLYLETKLPTSNSKPTPEQAAFMARLVERGYAVAVYRTLDAGVDLLTRYMRGEWTQTPEMLK